MADDINDWEQFINRYQKIISITIINECKRLGYIEGLNNIEELIDKVYNFLKNSGFEMRKINSNTNNTHLIGYLRIITLRAIRDSFENLDTK